MKTIKNYVFSLVTLVTLSFTLSSCDALTDALSKEVEIEAPAINFSVGETPTVNSPQQKVGAAAEEIVWLDDSSIDIKTKIDEELAKNDLTIDKVKTLLVTASTIELITDIAQNYNLGNIKLYINNSLVAQGVGNVSSLSKNIVLSYSNPYSIFSSLSAGKIHIKITSDQPKPNVKLDMKLLNIYKSKIGLL